MNKLAIDIDGCLNCLQDKINEILIRDFNVHAPLDEWDMLSHANIISGKDMSDFWNKYDPEFFNQEAEKDAAKILAELSKLGVELLIVTARGYNSSVITEKWLQKEEIKYDHLYMNSGNKVDVCKWKNIKIMVEDHPQNSLDLANNDITVLLMDRPYNRNINHENIIRCYNWLDIYKKITSIFKLIEVNNK